MEKLYVAATTVVIDNYLTIDITQIGSDLTVQIEY